MESGNEETLKRIHKSLTLKQTEKAIAMTKKSGIWVGANFILVHPYETLGTAMKTINYAVKLNANFNAIGIRTTHAQAVRTKPPYKKGNVIVLGRENYVCVICRIVK